MRIPRIFLDQPLQPGQAVALDDAAANHVARVLRLGVGSPVILFNGNGQEYSAEITEVDRKRVQVSVQSAESVDRESPLHIHLGIVISRGERMDFVLQKATELGVNEITPLISERCEVKLKGDRADKKLQHWQKVCISACEQCQRNVVPQVNNIQALTGWVGDTLADLKLVLHHRSAQPMQSYSAPQKLALLIGPEGGLTDSEIGLAEQKDFHSTLIGPRVLRTETAPLTAITLAQSLWGDFR